MNTLPNIGDTIKSTMIDEIKRVRKDPFKPQDFELMDTNRCPKHGCYLVMNVYKDPDSGRDCPKCRRERYGNAFVEQTLQEMAS